MEPVVGVTVIRKLNGGLSYRLSSPAVRLSALLVVPFALALSTALALSSGHVSHPPLAALFYGYSIAVSVSVGMYWWWRRPESGMGNLLYLLGIAFAFSSLQSSDNPLLYSIGVAADAPLTLLVFALPLAYPVGRLEDRADRRLIGALAAVLLVATGAWMLTTANATSGMPLIACQAGCPGNAFQLVRVPEAATGGLWAVAYTMFAAIALLVVGRFLDRVRRQPQAARRMALGLAATSLVILPAVSLFVVGSVVLSPTDALVQTAGVLLVGAVMLFPIGFAVPLIRADLDAAGAMRSLLHDLAADPSTDRWREQLAALLDDPSVKVGYWRAGSARYVAADGSEVSELDGDGRYWIPIERDSQPVAAIAIDRATAITPGLERVLAEATAVAVAADRVRDTRDELEFRAAEAAGYERERMARELQASTQQRLAAMRVQLAIATEGGTADDGLVEVGRDLDRAIRELRNVIWTAEPSVVTRGGVGRALRGVRQWAPIPIHVFDRELHRHPSDAEMAVYYCCLEAIQNAGKHAGPGAAVTVRLSDDYPDGIRFTISDDGVGFAPAADVRGAGLRNMRERVTRMGGQITVTGGKHGGTVVSGRVRDMLPMPTLAPGTDSEAARC
jgi:signal transduction histidine kinase